jgi:hypothetical protein
MRRGSASEVRVSTEVRVRRFVGTLLDTLAGAAASGSGGANGTAFLAGGRGLGQQATLRVVAFGMGAQTGG